MKIHSDITINERRYKKGDDVPWYAIYPFFLVHMLMFGGSGFLMAYAGKGAPVGFLYAHGGFALIVYTIFYLTIFGIDEVKWMLINAGLGLLGIYCQVGWLLSAFGKDIDNYPLYVHVIPFLYFVFYSFLLRHAVLDMFGVKEDETRKRKIEYGYIATSLAISGFFWLLERL